MKILIVTDAWTPQINGVVRTIQMTVRELQALGHEVEILSPDLFRSIPCPGYAEIRLALVSRRTIARRMLAMGPDALHLATEGPLGLHARSIALEHGWPFTTAYHTRFPEYLRARLPIPLSMTYRFLRRFHDSGTATLAATPAIVDDLRAHGFAAPRVWSRGVDTALFRPDGPREPRGDGPVFLHVGRIAVEKQVDEFLKLDLPGEKWVVGDGPERARLQAAYPGARWFGALQGESLARVFRSADVKVFTSVTDTFGLVLVEAMASGTPVAAFPVAGPIDVVGGSAGGVLDADLRRACLAALELSREGARAHAMTFSWAAATRQFLDALPLIRRGEIAGHLRHAAP
ncbi:glycosyltransferase family 4 protein [Scleromatobacter humisilvae]|uniref:Glycosyltransferase family 1 protein n=1 Tax=Scleromatobacter humisilvae TaxID=2897159 RepID=A0A9X2C2H9_9BURK|nr:glycosyltransferase family 1 protein [Scleromatobacter humisilvae]MCK9689357.1 glycosyltransferase family 1 protein [Scleromatobacter humisilvae]